MSGHCGYTNYETFIVATMIDNNQGDQEFWKERAREAWERTGDKTPNEFMGHSDNARRSLMEGLKDSFDSQSDHPVFAASEGSVYSDLLNSALCEVNWYEIADDMLYSLLENDEVVGFVSYQKIVSAS